MLNTVVIKKIDICSCENEANFIINAFGMKLHAYAQVDKDFASMIPIDREIELDLWLTYCYVRNSDLNYKLIENNDNSIRFVGEVEEIIDECSLRLNSGFLIDIDNELDIPLSISCCTYVEAVGSIRIYFPNTNYSNDCLNNFI